MSRIPIAYTTHLDTLWQAHLLCEICEEQAWTRRGTWHLDALHQALQTYEYWTGNQPPTGLEGTGEIAR